MQSEHDVAEKDTSAKQPDEQQKMQTWRAFGHHEEMALATAVDATGTFRGVRREMMMILEERCGKETGRRKEGKMEAEEVAVVLAGLPG